jgi:hypothetical protein
LQLFNQVNSRFIAEGEWNILKGFFSNKAFIAVYAVEWIMQFVMVEFMGVFTKCYPIGLNLNLICLGFGFISIPWGAIIKFIPSHYFKFEVDDHPLDEENKHGTASSIFKKSTIRKKEMQGKLEEALKQ